MLNYSSCIILYFRKFWKRSQMAAVVIVEKGESMVLEMEKLKKEWEEKMAKSVEVAKVLGGFQVAQAENEEAGRGVFGRRSLEDRVGSQEVED